MQGQRRTILLGPDRTPPRPLLDTIPLTLVGMQGSHAHIQRAGNFMSLTVNLEVEVGVESKGSQCPIPPREGVPPKGASQAPAPDELSGNSSWRGEGRLGEGCSGARVGVAGLRAHGCV